MSDIEKLFAKRINLMEASGIRKVFDLAKDIKNPVNLSIGQPNFDVPDDAKEAAIAAIRNGKNAYTQTQGGPELRESVSRYLGGRYQPSELIVASGGSGALMLAFLSLLEPGDEALIPDPYFVMYKQLVIMCGATPIFWDTYPDFQLHPEKLEAKITKRTKLIVFSSPANPTGAVYSEKDLRELARIADKHGIMVVSDEIYSFFSYEASAYSIADAYPNTLRIGGFSKSHAMTGWRLAWAAGPAKLIEAMLKLQQFTFVCAPSPLQIAAAYALEHPPTAWAAQYKAKRDRIYNGLKSAGYEVERPGGAFYIFPKTPWGTDSEFVEAAIKERLLVIPGNVFSEKKTNFRISYAAADETIDQGIEILTKLAKRGK